MTTQYLREEIAQRLQAAAQSGNCEISTFQLPAGCIPASCRMGFEQSGNAGKIYVERGIAYPGRNTAFHSFLQVGEFAFTHQAELDEFIVQLAEAVSAGGAQEPAAPQARVPAGFPSNPHTQPPRQTRIEDITDLSQINTASVGSTFTFEKESFLEDLCAEVRGQSMALQGITQAVGTHIRKKDPSRPVCLLLAGASGTGKTKTASLLSELLNRHTNQHWGFVRIDMNQMSEEHTVARLIGSPPGYVGHQETPLFEPLIHNPRQVILFDEMEKAHPKVLQTLMNAMASGRLEASRVFSDGERSFNFRNSVLVFTTNLILSSKAQTQAEITRECRSQLTRIRQETSTMLPEIANRFTEIILFNELGDNEKAEILVLSIVRLGQQYDLSVQRIDEKLVQDLARETVITNGVRDVEYLLESLLGEPFAEYAENIEYANNRSIALSGNAQEIEVIPMI